MRQLKLRSRMRFQRSQVQILEEAYQKQAFPDIPMRTELCAKLGVTMQQVTVWFQNRRMKAKRESYNYMLPSTPTQVPQCSPPLKSPVNLSTPAKTSVVAPPPLPPPPVVTSSLPIVTPTVIPIKSEKNDAKLERPPSTTKMILRNS